MVDCLKLRTMRLQSNDITDGGKNINGLERYGNTLVFDGGGHFNALVILVNMILLEYC